MRLILGLAVLALATPAYGADWTRYENERFGYAIAVPPGYVLESASDNGDGARFLSSDGDDVLTVWGGWMASGDFAAEASEAISTDEGGGWNVTYRAEAPVWVTYSGTRGRRVLYARSIATCGGKGTANFRLEYDQDEIDAMNATVMRLARSLSPGTAC